MQDDRYLATSASYQVTLVREYRQPAHYQVFGVRGELHSGEHFIEQGEREMKRMNGTLYRCAIGAVCLVAIIYCVVKFL